MVLERRLREVEAVVIDAELRRHVQLAGQVGLDPRELLRRHDVRDVQLAGAVLAELGAGIGVVQVMHVRDAVGLVVPVVAVALGDDLRADHPVAQYEPAVRHQAARARVLRAVLCERRPVHRERARLRQQPEQVWRRVDEPDHHGAVVRRADAERVGRLLAAHDGRSVHYRLEHLCIGRGRGRIHQPSHARHELGRADRIAVRPAQSIAQPERVLETVGTDGPRLSGRGHGTAVRAHRGQALEQVAEDVERRIGTRTLRVERLGLRAVAATQGGRVGGHRGLRVGRGAGRRLAATASHQ